MNPLKTWVFLDLDGTFWNRENVPDSAWKAVETARFNGHRVSISTGRKRDNLPACIHHADFDGWCLAAGMDLIHDGKTVASHTMDPDRAFALAAFMQSHRIGCSLETRDTAYDDALYRANRARYLKNAGRSDRSRRYAMENMPEEAWNQLVRISFDGADLAGLAREADRLEMDLFLYRSQHNPQNGIGATFKGEISQRGYDKGTAVDELLAALGQRRTDWRIAAIGDSENDLGMFEAADVSVCMGNGTDGALRAADFVTDSVDRDGLYKAFLHLGLLEKQED